MLHLVTAWSSENHLTLGQVACEEKSNEITAIPELLKLLSLKGATVTIDAMGCQKEIAAQIREQKGHYLLQAKGNQPKLEEQLVDYFAECLEADFAGIEHERHETTQTGHGRTETRIVDAVSLPRDFAPREDWKDLKTLVVVTSQRVVGGQEICESRYYITDHRPRAKFLGSAIRQHWGIENGQHIHSGCDVRRRLTPPAGPQRLGQPRRRPPPAAWPSACCGRRRRTNAASRTSACNAPSTPTTS